MSLPPKPPQGKNPRAKTIALAIALATITAILWIIYFLTGSEWNTPSIHWLPLAILATISSLVIFFLRITWTSSKKPSSFNLWIYGVTIVGGSTAFLFPLAIADFIGKDSEGSALRQMIIYATGGLLGAITLSETRRKNDLERSKFDKQNDQFTEQLNAQKENLKTELDAQKENLKTELDAQKENLKTQLDAQKENLKAELDAQKENLKTQLDSQLESQKEQINSQNEKDIRDHIRQVHAERRSRYTKAVEQLADDKAAVRLGGIYTLVGLVDEWLADENIKETDVRHKEGQVIINNLCAYIQSPFKLAAKAKELEADTVPATYGKEQFIADQAELHEEQNVRRTIFDEMSKRSSTIEDNNAKVFTPIPEAWSNFDFNFSRAPIFYPLNNLTIEKGNFTSAKFYGNADFAEVIFIEKADFSGAGFTQETSFKDATFAQEASFKGATFTHNADFEGATFTQEASFKDATFTQNVFFNGATFTQNVYFLGTIFAQDAYFSETTFTQDTYFLDATFTLIADFTKATFTQKVYSSRVVFPKQVYFVEATFAQDVYFVGATFSQNASFNGASFIQKAGFSGATFAQEAFFFGATFTQDADFNGATFTQDADFNGATFTQDADFSSAIFTQEADFRWTTFTKEVNFSNATFSQNADFGAALFENYVPTFVSGNLRAQFSTHSAQEDYNFFSLHSNSKTIPPGEAELDGVKRQIPVGTVLFDPDSGRTSESAKPIEESDSQGETPSK